MTTTTTSTADQVVTQSDFVLGVLLAAGFRVGNDGWLYPMGNGPLVRCTVNRGEYRMERRRNPESVWMLIVVAGVHEFDQEAFESWASNWPLLQ